MRCPLYLHLRERLKQATLRVREALAEAVGGSRRDESRVAPRRLQLNHVAIHRQSHHWESENRACANKEMLIVIYSRWFLHT